MQYLVQFIFILQIICCVQSVTDFACWSRLFHYSFRHWFIYFWRIFDEEKNEDRFIDWFWLFFSFFFHHLSSFDEGTATKAKPLNCFNVTLGWKLEAKRNNPRISNEFDLIRKVQIEPVYLSMSVLRRHSQFRSSHWLVPMLLHVNAIHVSINLKCKLLANELRIHNSYASTRFSNPVRWRMKTRYRRAPQPSQINKRKILIYGEYINFIWRLYHARRYYSYAHFTSIHTLLYS